jgi:hypothetical protein
VIVSVAAPFFTAAAISGSGSYEQLRSNCSFGWKNKPAQPRERLGGSCKICWLDLAVVVAESDIDLVSDPQREA